MDFKRSSFFVAVILAICSVCQSDASDFRSVLTNVRLLDGQRVTLVGVVVGDGPEFELFESPSEARNIAPASRSFFLRAKTPWKRVRPFDLYRVRVTGIVHADRHGIWGNPCEIWVENIEALSKDPVIEPSMPSGVFRNDGQIEVSVKLFGPSGIQATFELAPRQRVELPINDGMVKVFSLDGTLMAETPLGVSRLSRYYDRKHGAFYYRITDKRVERTVPTAVDYWRWAQ